MMLKHDVCFFRLLSKLPTGVIVLDSFLSVSPIYEKPINTESIVENSPGHPHIQMSEMEGPYIQVCYSCTGVLQTDPTDKEKKDPTTSHKTITLTQFSISHPLHLLRKI